MKYLILFQKGLQKYVKSELNRIGVGSIELLLNGFAVVDINPKKEKLLEQTPFRRVYRVQNSFEADLRSMYGLITRTLNKTKLKPDYLAQPASLKVEIYGKQTFSRIAIKRKAHWFLDNSGFYMGKTHKKNSIAHFLFFCSGNYAYLARKVELDPLQIETVPGSLPYEVASYLVHLSNPEPTDVFLDPMCGAGTVLYARAQHPLRSLTGFDINSEAIKIARRNLKSLPVKINQTDSRLMRSVPDESFSKIIVNPPWDEKIIEGTDLLYSDMMEGFLRVLAPGGTVVLLTSKKEPMEKALRGALTVYPETSYGVADTIFINGIKAFVYRVFKA